MKENYTLLTDLYQLTMAQGYWKTGKVSTQASFTMYFRQAPFKGGYALACGMAQLADLINNFAFSDEDIAYLASVPAPGGGLLFDQAFLDYLRTFHLTCNVDAAVEGAVVFPHEPLVRVTGPLIECQLLETALLNCVNFETLIATKAARVCSASGGHPVAEFGLRRAQGAGGGLWASRAAVVGGCASTSNVLAGKEFGIPVSGTHAHSWVMSYPSELEAFRAYAENFPTNCVLLVDTYDVMRGVENAITVGLEMRARGQRLSGIRIDSGDLAWLSRKARIMLDQAGLTDCGIVLSNDLDEYTMESLLAQGAQVTAWGVGTKLATAFDQPTLGGVYKMCALREHENDAWTYCMKVTEASWKITVPGVLGVRRFFDNRGFMVGDMVYDLSSDAPQSTVIIDANDELTRKDLKGFASCELLVPLARNGKSVLAPELTDAWQARTRAQANLATLDDSHKRFLNPHRYPVGLEQGLFERRRALMLKLRGISAKE